MENGGPIFLWVIPINCMNIMVLYIVMNFDKEILRM